MGLVLGHHARTDRTRDTQVAAPWLPAPDNGRAGEGQRLTPDAPHNGGRPPPPGTAPHDPCGARPPQGMQANGTVSGLHTHTPAPTARGWRTPTAHPVSGQSGEGERLSSDAPHNGGWHPPRGTPFRHPHSEQRRPARAHAVGLVLGPHARTVRTGDTRVAEPRLPASEGRQRGEGQRLTPDAPHNGGRPTPPGTAPHHPHGTQPPQGMQAKGTVVGPHTHTPAPTARGWRTPTARPVGRQSGEGERLTSDAPHSGGRHPPRGRPSATPTASNAGPQGRTLWGRCWVPTPAPTKKGACCRLGYPKTLCSSLPVSWSEKDRYMTRNSKTKGRRVGSFLEFFRIQVWRVPYEACIPLEYGDPIHRLNQQIKQSIPGTKLFAVNRPQPNLRKRWHRALVKTLNDLGNVQPAADSLSMDASLILNCRAAAENGNCSQSKRRRVA